MQTSTKISNFCTLLLSTNWHYAPLSLVTMNPVTLIHCNDDIELDKVPIVNLFLSVVKETPFFVFVSFMCFLSGLCRTRCKPHKIFNIA